MAKYLNRLNARIARAALAESAKESKNWIVSKKLILETEEGEMEFEKGDIVEIGATDEGDLAMKNSAAVVVVSDADLASKIADVVVNADELSEINFVEKPALDAMLDGENVDDVIDTLADTPVEDIENDNIEVAELDVERQESVENKFNKFSENRINSDRAFLCEAIQIAEDDTSSLNIRTIKADKIAKESVFDYNKFVARVSELNGSLQPGEREVALAESGKVMGAFDKNSSNGILFLENEFDGTEEMDNFETGPEDLVQDIDFGGEDAVVEAALATYEESSKTGADYDAMVEALEKANLVESMIATIVNSFNVQSLKECVRVYDSKFGKYVATFSESVDADNFIAETAEAKRFSKRFFA